MPLYEYACLECGTRFDLLRGTNDADQTTICATCSGTRVRRLLSVIAAPRAAVGAAGGETSYSGGCGCGGACSCRN